MPVWRHVIFALWLLYGGLAGSDARAEDAAPIDLGGADRAAIHEVIERQLDAFQHDDNAAAFRMAAPSIKAMFGNPDNFMTMVRNGFQPLYRTKEHSFDRLVEEGGQILQRMRVVGLDGVAHMALYAMERQPDGHWLIAGCVLLDLHEEGV